MLFLTEDTWRTVGILRRSVLDQRLNQGLLSTSPLWPFSYETCEFYKSHFLKWIKTICFHLQFHTAQLNYCCRVMGHHLQWEREWLSTFSRLVLTYINSCLAMSLQHLHCPQTMSAALTPYKYWQHDSGSTGTELFNGSKFRPGSSVHKDQWGQSNFIADRELKNTEQFLVRDPNVLLIFVRPEN